MHLIVIQISNITISKPLRWITSRRNYFWYEHSRLLLWGRTGVCLTVETLRLGLGGNADTWFSVNANLHYEVGTAVTQWLRCCATNRKAAGSIPDVVIGIFPWRNPSDHAMALGSTQPVTEMSTRRIFWGLMRQERKADNLSNLLCRFYRHPCTDGLLYLTAPFFFSVPLQAWSGPEGSRKLRFPDFMTTAQGGGKIVSHTYRSHLPPGNPPGTHFYYRLSRPQGHSAIGRIMSTKNSNSTIWNRTSDLPIFSTAP